VGIRSNVELTIQLGKDNDLTKLQLDRSWQQLLDTLEHATTYDATLEAGESNHAVPFGDVSQCRLVYIEADGPLRITPGGGTSTSGQLDGVLGSYPTGFDGTADNLDLEIDGAAVSVDFESTDQSLTQVINRVNAAAALAGIVGPGSVPTTIARNNGSAQLRLKSPTTGVTSIVEVLNTSAAGVLAALGLTATSNTGLNASPGQTPLTLLKPADTTGSDEALGVMTYLLATMVTTAFTIDNLDPDNAVNMLVAICGDLTPADPC
jgi:hypothetical protein